jgi:hypothetical protein
MASVTVDYPETLRDLWARAPEVVAEALTTAVLESALLYQREVVERTPVGVGGGGGLRGSIQAAPPRGEGDAVIGIVGTALPYAPAVEFGAKPHMPPVASLRLWVEHKLGLKDADADAAAWAIARAIAKRGTEGAHMFETALAATEGQIATILRTAVGRLAQRLGGGR